MNLRRAASHSRRRTDNWSFHQYIESPVRPCPCRGIEWSHAATSFRLAAHTVSSNDPADLDQPSSSMSMVSPRCLCSLSLLSRLVFQEGLLPFLSSPEVELQELQFLPHNIRSSALNIGQETLPETWATFFSPLSAQVRHRGGALHSLATCDAPPPLHLQQASFLSGSVQPRETWPYPWHMLSDEAVHPPHP